jgi:hypothetical protein
MLRRCGLCAELLTPPVTPQARDCLLCMHRTTPLERQTGQPAPTGLMDAA